jgi:hypothetical protein
LIFHRGGAETRRIHSPRQPSDESRGGKGRLRRLRMTRLPGVRAQREQRRAIREGRYSGLCQKRRLTRLTKAFSKKRRTCGPHTVYTSLGTTSAASPSSCALRLRWRRGSRRGSGNLRIS